MKSLNATEKKLLIAETELNETKSKMNLIDQNLQDMKKDLIDA